MHIHIDPRQNHFAEVPCPHCEAPVEVTHKDLRLSFCRADRVLEQYPHITVDHEMIQLCEMTCKSCYESFVIKYDFEEFAMSAYAFRIVELQTI